MSYVTSLRGGVAVQVSGISGGPGAEDSTRVNVNCVRVTDNPDTTLRSIAVLSAPAHYTMDRTASHSDIQSFIRRLPKAELHLHLEGAITLAMLVDLSARKSHGQSSKSCANASEVGLELAAVGKPSSLQSSSNGLIPGESVERTTGWLYFLWTGGRDGAEESPIDSIAVPDISVRP